MAELVDALVSGTSVRKDVEVRVFFWAPNFEGLLLRAVLFVCLKPNFQAAPAFAVMNRTSAYALILLFTPLFILLFGGSSYLAAYRNPAPALVLNSTVPLIPATAWLYLSLPLFLVCTAQTGEAQRNLEEALTLATEADLTAQIHDDLGNALYTQENLAQALHHYEQAAARFEQLHGMNHPKTAQAYTHAAAVYRQQDHTQEALSILQHTTQILETTAPAHHPSIALAHCELAAAHDALKHYLQAAEHYHQAAQHLARSVGTDHPLYAKYLCRHAYHHLQTHRPEQALTQLHQALLIFMNTYEDDHPIIHNTIQNIVLLMMMTGNDHPD